MSRESILGQRRAPVRGSSTGIEPDPERFRFPIHVRLPFSVARVLQMQAKDRGITFSERVRQALRQAASGGPALPRPSCEACSTSADRPPATPSSGAEEAPQGS